MFQAAWSLSLTLSLKTAGRPGRSLRTCLHLNGQSIRGAFQRNFFSQTDRGSTGTSALTSCKTSVPLSRPKVHFLFGSWTSLMCGLKDKTTTFTSSTCSSWMPQFTSLSKRMPGGLRFHGTLAHLLICQAIARLLARRQLHNAPSLHTARSIQQNVSAEYHILEVLNCELTTPWPAAWIADYERHLPLWEEQELKKPHHPHIVLVNSKTMQKPRDFVARTESRQSVIHQLCHLRQLVPHSARSRRPRKNGAAN